MRRASYRESAGETGPGSSCWPLSLASRFAGFPETLYGPVDRHPAHPRDVRPAPSRVPTTHPVPRRGPVPSDPLLSSLLDSRLGSEIRTGRIAFVEWLLLLARNARVSVTVEHSLSRRALTGSGQPEVMIDFGHPPPRARASLSHPRV